MATQAEDINEDKKRSEARDEFIGFQPPDVGRIAEEVVERVTSPITELFDTQVETPGLLVRAYAFGVVSGVAILVLAIVIVKALV